MNKNELRDLHNVLTDDFGVNTIYRILKELGAFDNGLIRTSSSKEDYLLLGKREKGKWLLKCVFQADNKKFLEILNKEYGNE